MRKKEAVLSAILDQKLLPLYYHDDVDVCKSILFALYNAGVKVVEFTNRGEQAVKNFRAIQQEAQKHMPGISIGVGTIKTKKQAEIFIDEGASFLVSPIVNEEISGIAGELLWIPGCMTPTEIAVAEECGAPLVKIFPGNTLGPSYIKSVREVFPALKFMPTGIGETDESSLKSWFKAGVAGIGLGSRLISKELIDNNDYEEITNATVTMLQLVNKVSDLK